MNLVPWRRRAPEVVERADAALALTEYISQLNVFGYNGHQYTIPGAKQEEPTAQFASMVQAAYKSSGVVFACMLARMTLVSQARFQYRGLQSGRPGKLFGTTDLRPLERPWSGASTSDLLSRMMQYADLAGNAYVVRRGPKLRLLRPDWVTLVLGSDLDPDVAAWDVDAEVLGYIYEPGGKQSNRPAQAFLADEVAHFAPIPDPEAQFRGMSWLTPIVKDIMGDKAMTDHRLASFENGAAINLLVKFNVDSVEKMRPWMEAFRESHEGAGAEKTLFLGAGTDATPIGMSFQQSEFKITQGAVETRIAAAAGVPPVYVGLSEGLQAATYANYAQARRRLADGTIRPLWADLARSLEQVVAVPKDSELWYDDRDIPFLQEDQKDAAEIMSTNATAIGAFVTAGFTPESARDAVETGDLGLLTHSGLVSVQLQKPGHKPGATDPVLNGTNGSRAISAELLTHAIRTAREG